jgi:hypothetical protein
MARMDTTRHLTYTEIASLFGIGTASARNLVRRKGWPKAKGNDGLARIRVPADAVPDAPAPKPSMQHDAATMLARLEVEIAGLRELIEAERARADAAAADRDRWHAEACRPILSRLFGRRA